MMPSLQPRQRHRTGLVGHADSVGQWNDQKRGHPTIFGPPSSRPQIDPRSTDRLADGSESRPSHPVLPSFLTLLKKEHNLETCLSGPNWRVDSTWNQPSSGNTTPPSFQGCRAHHQTPLHHTRAVGSTPRLPFMSSAANWIDCISRSSSLNTR
jgi:hypothetical protein